MSSNPFAKWPLWHYETLHFQNLRHIDDAVRQYIVAGNAIPANSIPELREVVPSLIVYDFMNDAIVPASSIENLHLVGFADLNNPAVVARLPEDVYLLPKGRPTNTGGVLRGGEFMPMVGTRDNMVLVARAILSQIQIRMAERNPALTAPQPFDVFANLSAEEQARVTALLERPVYQSVMIDVIRASFERTGTQGFDIERAYTRIRNALTKTIQDTKAINVSSGQPVSATSRCYNIMEMSVITDEGEDPRVVRFAFPNKIGDAERDALLRMLRERFRAEQVRASEPVERDRATVALRPFRVTGEIYRQMFPEASGSFQQYIAQLNAITQRQEVDTTQTLHGAVDNDPDATLDDIDEDDVDVNDF